MTKAVRAIDRYDNGNVRYRGANVDGKMHGSWKFFRRDGSLMRSGSFANGKQVGVWRTFNAKGKLVKETEFTTPTPGSTRSRQRKRTTKPT